MDVKAEVERKLEAAVSRASRDVCPPGLASAVSYAVFPGGARIRPLLCLGVAQACGNVGDAALSGAAAIEMLHCASLVHDDLPCFDDADTRRGKPTVHRAFGQPLAVLAGDALIVLAFETVATACQDDPRRLPAMVGILSRSVGMTSGLIAGQAWESEAEVAVGTYHAAKTGALFVAVAMMGAASAGADAAAWKDFGSLLGEAYQVADDIRDATSTEGELGKPVGRDAALGRPTAVNHLGLGGAVAHLDRLIDRALQAVPACPGQVPFREKVRAEVRWFVPKDHAQFAA